MSQTMFSGFLDPGFVNVQRAKAKSNIGDGNDLTTPASYTSLNALDARLTAINSTYYTAARLNAMTANDKVYAVRMNDDPTTVK